MPEPRPSQKPQSRKIEQKEFIFPSDPDPLFEGYFNEIRNRKFQPRTNADVEKVVSLELSVEPITQLTEGELHRLKEYLRKSAQLDKRHINTTYHGLAENQIYYISGELRDKLKEQDHNLGSIFWTQIFFDSTTINFNERLLGAVTSLKNLGISPLKPEELIKLLADPEILSSSRYVSEYDGVYHQESSNPLLSEGSRHLYRDEKDSESYGYASAEDFKNTLQRIKKRTGKSILTILDIGGNVGQALLDAKRIDSSLKTINMTLDSLPVISGDIIARRPAEYMPAVFEENIDLIESNYAFRYFLFPDIALRNAVKALSIGGETNLYFSNDACPLGEEELLERIKKVFTWLQKLEQEEYIEVVRNGEDPFSVEGAYLGRELKITKKKSTMGL